jgi:hypothetical protein
MNVDHYNNHPVVHNAITAVYGVVAISVIAAIGRRARKSQEIR